MQKGAVSVAIPADGSIPEEVEAFAFGENIFFNLRRSSNLLPLGGTVLEWEKDYRELARLLEAVSQAFARETALAQFVLDFEYKKVAPEGTLAVKQVRRIPEPDTRPNTTPFLLNEPLEFLHVPGGGERRFLQPPFEVALAPGDEEHVAHAGEPRSGPLHPDRRGTYGRLRGLRLRRRAGWPAGGGSQF